MSSPRYRPVNFGVGRPEVFDERDDGTLFVRSTTPLGAVRYRMVDCLFAHAQASPDRTLFARRDAHGQWEYIGYGAAKAAALRIAQALISRGLSAHRPVLVLSGNSLQHALLALGCMCAGVPYAPVSPAYSLLDERYETLRHVISLLTPGLVFVDDGTRFAAALSATVPSQAEVVVSHAGSVERDVTPFDELSSIEPTKEVECALAATGPDTIVKFLFTSGSTKLPKAVINTNRMWASNLAMQTAAWPFLADEPPVFVDWLPWHHTFGGNQNFGLTLYHGGSLYIDDGRPTPECIGTTLSNLREISPTIYFNVPKGWSALSRALEADSALRERFYRRLQLQFYAGASLEQPVWDRLHATAHAQCGERIAMSTGLGMTETAPAAMLVVELEAGAGQIGVPLPGVELKLAPVTYGSSRKLEVRYRGPNVTPGYWRAPAQTAAAFDADGYFCSGDAVRWLDANQRDRGFAFDGRLSENFKLSTGAWVVAAALRERVMAAGRPYVDDALVIGQDKNDIGVLLVPNLAACRKLAHTLPQAPGVLDADSPSIYAHPEVIAFFRGVLDRLYAEGTSSATRVCRIALLDPPPSIDCGEVTDKGSMIRGKVLANRAAVVDALYQSDGLLTP